MSWFHVQFGASSWPLIFSSAVEYSGNNHLILLISLNPLSIHCFKWGIKKQLQNVCMLETLKTLVDWTFLLDIMVGQALPFWSSTCIASDFKSKNTP